VSTQPTLPLPPTPDDGKRPPRTITLTTGKIVAASIVGVLVLGALIALGYAAYENNRRADDWRDRAAATQAVLNARTKDLNRQTARLNKAAEALQQAQGAAARSEADVSELETRQRELAAEKAAIEDERAQLRAVAAELAICNEGLLDFIADLDTGQEPPPESFDFLVDICSSAGAALEGYLDQYGLE
jgi:septal ring factor EnvC (AmiA/AmiB activator)